GVSFDGAALSLPSGDVLVVSGETSLRSSVVDSWCRAGHRIVADEFVWMVDGEVAALHIGRQMPIGDHIHVLGRGNTDMALDGDDFAPVCYLQVPDSLRATDAARVRAVLSLKDGGPESGDTQKMMRMRPEDAFVAVMRARAGAGLCEKSVG